MGLDVVSMAIARNYTDKSIEGLGTTIKGANCTIKSTTKIGGDSIVTFEWTGTNGTKQTSSITVSDGVSITNISIDANNNLVCTMSDGTEYKSKIDLLDNVYTKSETNTLLLDKAEKTHNHNDLYASKDTEHEHSNKETLDKFGVNDGGKLTFNGDVVTPEAMDLGDYLKKTDAQNTYVEKETGKGLSENDFTTVLKDAYDKAVEDSHTHSNKSIIDKFSEDSDGKLLYDGQSIEADLSTVYKKTETYSQTESDDKFVAKESGKGLSANDLTNDLKSSYDDAVTAKHTHDNKTVLDGITAEKVEAWDKAEANVQSDWNETDDTADGFIKNKPTIPSLDGYAKTTDIPTKISQLENDSNYLSSIPEEYVTETELSAKGYLTEHQDISGKVDKVEGKSLISDTEIVRLASVDNYDDTQVKTQIQAVANGLMDSVGYSADYKSIDIIAKNSEKKSIDVAPIISHASITELSDVDTTNKATGKALVYNATTSKHEYADVSGTDEKVKMDASTDAKYLGELLDNVTIANENGELKVKKLDGQEVTITEINYLKGLTMNVMDLVNMFSNGGVKIINTPVATYVELLTLDKSSFIEGISYLVYVLADENHDNAKTTYLVDKDSETPTYFGFADSQRDFTTNPIDLATEITGKLGIANMDSDAIKALFTVDDTYKTETATNNAFSTHGAKALYDELLLAIGNKANSSDLTAHKDDADIHVSTEDRTKWDSAKTHADSAHAPSNAQENVLETVKVNGAALEVSNKAVNVTVPTTVSELTDSADYAKKTDIPTTLPANGGNADTVNNHTVETDVPTDAVFTDTIYDDTEVKGSIAELSSNLDTLSYDENAGGKNLANVDNISNVFKFKVSGNRTYIVSANGANTYRVLGFKNGEHTKNILLDIDLINDCIIEPSSLDIDEIYIDFTNKVIGFLDDKLFLRYYEDKDAPYEPYIPSVKMLANENVYQNTEAMDLKMLGWTVPSECPVQNYVDGNGVFHQRVGRVDLGSLDFVYGNTDGQYCFSSTEVIDNCKGADDWLTTIAKGYSSIYNITVWSYNRSDDNYDKTIAISPGSGVSIRNSSYTDADTFKNAMKGVYLYYELATEITKTIDGNEAVTSINSNLDGLSNAIDGLNSDSYWEQGTWNILGQKVDTPTIIRTKEKLILPIDYLVSLVNSNYVYEVDYYENGAYKNNTGWISGSIVIPKGQEFALLIRKVDTSDLVPTECNAISVLPKNIGTINESLSVIRKRKNLLKPTLQTTTLNGVTCTANGDGTYTLNGTATTGDTFFDLIHWSKIAVGNYIVVGCPIGGSKDGYYIEVNAPKATEENTYYQETGSGVTFETYNKADNNIIVRIRVIAGTTVSNLVFKPMLTEDLTATYDDFVPYTGDGETLTHDVAKLNENLSVIGKCKNLLNPTLQTTTQNGVTCTNNGDGTYTLNGTATQNTDFTFFDNLEKYQHLKNRTVKLVGCPKGGSDTTYRLMLQLQKAPWPSAIDIGKGSSVTVDNNDNWACWIRIYKDATVSNLTFKPMLVFDDKTPNATYDDFVPYTGEGETLTHDVAEIKNDLGGLSVDCNNCQTLYDIINLITKTNICGIGLVGDSVDTNIKTLLGSPNMGNYVEASIMRLNNISQIWEIVAIMKGGTNVKTGYIYNNDNTWVWTGWK